MADKIEDVIYKIVSKAVHTKSYSNPEMDKGVADIKELLHRKVNELDEMIDDYNYIWLDKLDVHKNIDNL